MTLRRDAGILNPFFESWRLLRAWLVMALLGLWFVWKNNRTVTASSHSVLFARHRFLYLIYTITNSVALLNANSYGLTEKDFDPQVNAKDETPELL